MKDDLPPPASAIKLALEAAAEAAYQYQVKAAQKELADLSFPHKQIEETLEEVRDCADDRAAVITLFALVDDLTISLMQRNLDPSIRGGLGRLFDGGGFGILGTSSARFTMAAALRWLRPETYSDLDLLRKIRNAFAHKVSVRTLTDEPVRGLFASMTPADAHFRSLVADIAGPGKDWVQRPFATLTPRQRFLLTGAALLRRIIFELPALPVAAAHKVSALDAMGRWKQAPEAFREATFVILEAVWFVLFLTNEEAAQQDLLGGTQE
ncbi:hypothetical protein GXW78_26530 [Roseomonas terrae]|uniref:Uncharacterized protein n=1 Tax=Neoroseomonas terrae TaxID=424799 RepID=A0ABS5EQC4_9PROT|nr:hypothetical protein [Neoroseomonas terrae]MBR0653237.1 hypothetical protein [Neoroseomonas terrae]